MPKTNTDETNDFVWLFFTSANISNLSKTKKQKEEKNNSSIKQFINQIFCI